MRLIKALSFAILLSWLGLAGPANAFSCTATVTLNFGTVDLTEGLAIAGQGTVAVNCSGGGSGQVLRACPGIATPRQMTRSAGGQITYDLYSDVARTAIWGQTSGNVYPPPVDVTLNAGGSGSNSIQIYGLIAASQTAAPTTVANSAYAQSPAVVVGSADATGSPTCATIGALNASTGSAVISATYLPVCTIVASPLAFGNVTSLQSAIDAQTSMSTRCSAGTPYEIWLNGGLTNPPDPTLRAMQHGADRLAYGLFQNSQRTSPWGDTVGSNVLGGTGSGQTIALPVYGRILASQITPPPGNYSDTVIATINY